MRNGPLSHDRLAARLSRRFVTGSLFTILLGLASDRCPSTAAQSRSGQRKHRDAARQHHRPHTQRVTGEIVGGTVVPAGAYPFQVALLDHRYGEKRFRRQFCAGSLLDARHVLTAAHCVSDRKSTKPLNLRVAVGLTALNHDSAQARDVESIAIHPAYDAHRFEYDAALLRLAEPVDLTTAIPIRPAGPADTSLEMPGTDLTIIGWGSTRPHLPGRKAKNKSPKYAHSLRQTTVTVIDDEQCLQAYHGKRVTPVAPAMMICAAQPGRDSCTGDSGGPLFATTPDGFVLVGIISWGVGCAAPDHPGVYTRISALTDFLHQELVERSP